MLFVSQTLSAIDAALGLLGLIKTVVVHDTSWVHIVRNLVALAYPITFIILVVVLIECLKAKKSG